VGFVRDDEIEEIEVIHPVEGWPLASLIRGW
jgi:hypothetical protein